MARTPTGGSITIAYPHEPPTLDPFSPAGESLATRDLVRLVMPSLYALDAPTQRRLSLLAAEPVVVTQPRFSVTLTLRDDAVWSDGRPITVADLRFTWRTARARKIAEAPDYARIRAVVAETPKRARLEFARPFRRWRDLFSSGLGVLPAHAARDRARRWPVSGGPFVIERWRPGLDITFARNPRSWQTAELDRVRVAFAPDPSGARELLRRGRVQALGPYLSPNWTGLGVRSGGRVAASGAGATWAALVLNTGRGPLRELAVRRALADSVDRARLVRGLVQDQGAPLEDVPPVGEARGAFARYGNNLGRAVRALERAGWRGEGTRRKRGRALRFTVAVVNADELAAVVTQAVQFQAARAGIEIEAIGLDTDDMWTEWLHGERFEAAVVVWREPPEGGLRRFVAPGNLARLSDPQLARLFRAADEKLGESDPYGRARSRLASLVPVLPLFAVSVPSLTKGMVSDTVGSSADGPFVSLHRWALARRGSGG